MEELFGLCINSVQCQQVLLGCHSDDLSTILRQHRKDALAMNRITLLKAAGPKNDPPFASFAKAEFPSVFKNSLLPADIASMPASMVSSDDLGQLSLQSRINGHPLSESSKLRKPLESYSSTNGYNSASPKLMINGHSPSPSRNTSNGHNSDLFSFTPAQALRTTWAPDEKIVLLNVNDERVDNNLGPIDADASVRVAERCEKNKICNDFHLRDKCLSASCTFAHAPRLDPKEMVVLKYKARYLICERGSACRIPDCWHGHMCPHRNCSRPTFCRFRHLHHVDKTAVTVWRGSESKKRMAS